MRLIAISVLAVCATGCSIIKAPETLNELMTSYTTLAKKVESGFEKIEEAMPTGALESFKAASQETKNAIDQYATTVGKVGDYLGRLQEGDKEAVQATVGTALDMLGRALGIGNLGAVLVSGALGTAGSVPAVNFFRDRRRRRRGEPTGSDNGKESTGPPAANV